LPQFGSTEYSRYGVTSLATEEIAFIDEFMAAIFIGYEMIVFPHPNGGTLEEVIQEILSCVGDHR